MVDKIDNIIYFYMDAQHAGGMHYALFDPYAPMSLLRHCTGNTFVVEFHSSFA